LDCRDCQYAVKPFITANAITTDILEKVFHPAGPGAQLLASEIPDTGKAAKLISLSLHYRCDRCDGHRRARAVLRLVRSS
jgi:hypothetical protein